jgi:hypothetical protein
MKKADRKLRRKSGTLAKKQRRQARISPAANVIEFNWLNPWTWFKQGAA